MTVIDRKHIFMSRNLRSKSRSRYFSLLACLQTSVPRSLHSGGSLARLARILPMDGANQIALTFRCPAELEGLIPRPIPAVLGLPTWYKSLPQKAFSSLMGQDYFTVKKCPPFIDAMTYGFLIPLAIDLEVKDGHFAWHFDTPKGFVSEYAHSPISFHDPVQVAGTPLFDDDRFIIKFNNFWNIQAPPGYSLFFTHPVNRPDLPFTTFTGLVDCDAYYDSPINFPARWHDAGFNGVLSKGTPVAQCVPVKREVWIGRYESFSAGSTERLIEIKETLARENDVYRRQFRAPKR